MRGDGSFGGDWSNLVNTRTIDCAQPETLAVRTIRLEEVVVIGIRELVRERSVGPGNGLLDGDMSVMTIM